MVVGRHILVLSLMLFTALCYCEEHTYILNEHEAWKYVRQYNSISQEQLHQMASEYIQSSQNGVDEMQRELHGFYDDYQSDSNNASDANHTTTCLKHSYQVVQDFLAGKPYAMQMLDAFGKLPSGVLQGNFKWLGSYEQCQKVIASNFTGKYCATMIKLPKDLPLGQYGTLTLGICAPNTCNYDELEVFLNMTLSLISPLQDIIGQLEITAGACQQKKLYSTSDIIAIVILSILGLLSLIGTLYDAGLKISMHLSSSSRRSIVEQGTKAQEYPGTGDNLNLVDNEQVVAVHDGNNDLTSVEVNSSTASVSQHPGPDKVSDDVKMTGCTVVVEQALLCFSWLKNGSKLLNTTVNSGNLSSVNGIRVLSMWWVILGHTYSFVLIYIDNPLPAISMIQRFSFQAISNATFSVDSFFFLSGLLVSYLTLKGLKRQEGRINWAMFYFHRFWRLTPVYMMVMMFFTTLLYHIPDGPFTLGHILEHETNKCRTYWWSNLLYVNNFVPGDLSGQCMAWSWYLANDMQFYVISPFILYILYRWWKPGVGVIFALIIFCLGLTGGISRKHDLQISLEGGGMNGVDGAQIYIRPYYRISTYLVGILAGYIIYATRCKLQMPRIVAAVGWGAAIAINISVLYGIYSYNKNNTMMNLDLSAFYLATCRFAWSVGLAWLTLACLTGYGGPVNRFLSWSAWVPLGRLTYCAYLVHPFVLYSVYANRKALIHVDDITMIYIYIGNIVISYMLAFCVSMLVEAPMMGLEKVIFKRSKKSTAEAAQKNIN